MRMPNNPAHCPNCHRRGALYLADAYQLLACTLDQPYIESYICVECSIAGQAMLWRVRRFKSETPVLIQDSVKMGQTPDKGNE